MCKTVHQSAFVISLQERRGPLLHCLAKVLQLFEVSETVGGCISIQVWLDQFLLLPPPHQNLKLSWCHRGCWTSWSLAPQMEKIPVMQLLLSYRPCCFFLLTASVWFVIYQCDKAELCHEPSYVAETACGRQFTFTAIINLKELCFICPGWWKAFRSHIHAGGVVTGWLSTELIPVVAAQP